MKRIAVVSAVLDEPHQCQKEFNEIVSVFQGMIKGRMGIPFEEAPVAVICITVVGELDEINREFNAHYEVDDKRGGNRGGCSMM